MGGSKQGIWSERQKHIALAALVVAILVLVAYTMTRGSVSDAQLAASAKVDAKAQRLAITQPTEAALPHVAFLGDSYTGGSKMNSGTATLYSSLLAEKVGFVVDSFSVGGSGFLAPGQTHQSFGLRVAAVLAAQPDVVVIEGGHNDGMYPEAQVQAAARKVLTRIHAGLPKAKIIVLGPIWPSGNVPPSERAIDGDLKRLAGSVGARFVDPIEDGWFSGRYAKLIGPDSTHPTDAGHSRIARLLEPVFAGAVPKVAS